MSMQLGQNLRIKLRESNYLPYQLQLTALQTNTQNKLFFSCFTSGSCGLAKYTKFCIVWQQISVICCELSGGGRFAPKPPSPVALPLNPVVPCAPLPPNPGYATDLGSNICNVFIP